jgi:hypothetical protein
VLSPHSFHSLDQQSRLIFFFIKSQRIRRDKKSIEVAMEVMQANKFPAVIDLVAEKLD